MSYKIHYVTGKKNVHHEDMFACGKHQQMSPLQASGSWAEVTCKPCLRTRKFDIFHPDWDKWCRRIAWELRYTGKSYNMDNLTVSHVMGKIVDLGFTLFPPLE